MTQRISLRFWFCISLSAFFGGSAYGSLGLLRVMRAFKYAEAGGFLAVGRGIAEANRSLIGASFIGIACMIVAVVDYHRSRTWPSASSILSTSALAFVLFAVFWIAESLLVNALLTARNGVIVNATLVQRLLSIVFDAGISLSVTWLFAWALRFTPTATPKRTVAALSLVVAGFLLVAIALQLRNTWINDMYARL